MTWVVDGIVGRTPVRSTVAGSVPATSEALALPVMVPVRGERAYGVPDDAVRGWITAEPVADARATWRRWARTFDRTGLWPLRAGSLDGWRPFRAGELGPQEDVPPVQEVLRQRWDGCGLVRPDGTRLPHPPWPGLAAGRGATDASGILLGEEFSLPVPGDLLLVPASRPADTLARLGWRGAVNWSLSGADITAVLRSWEDRFGAYVVHVGFATLDLVVTRPPVVPRHCALLAAEHMAFCPDNLQKCAELLDDYARSLRGAGAWHFWWD